MLVTNRAAMIVMVGIIAQVDHEGAIKVVKMVDRKGMEVVRAVVEIL